MELLTTTEAAKLMRVSSQTVRDLCDQKKLVAIRPTGNPNGRRRIVADSVDRYLLSLIEADEPKRDGYVPQFVQFDDSERELQKLIAIGKKRRKA